MILFKRYIFICSFVFVTNIEANTIRVLASPYEVNITHQYFIDLLHFALNKSQPEFKLPTITILNNELSKSHPRTRHYIKNHLVDISWAGTDAKLEKVLLPVRIPLLRGLLGYRIFIIHHENLSKFEGVTLKDLKKLNACQGSEWGDSDILESNGFNVIRVERLDLMFKMLQRKRCDYFPRAIFEGYNELKIAKEKYPELMIFDKVLLKYNFPLYFFVNKENTALAEQLSFGLKKSIDDGSYMTFMKNNKFTSSLFPLSKWQDKEIFELKNPYLPPLTQLNEKSLWINLQR